MPGEVKFPDRETALKAQAVKDSLENLCLYLNEIEKIINCSGNPEEKERNRYRLQVLERYIADMNDLFKLLSSEGKSGQVILS